MQPVDIPGLAVFLNPQDATEKSFMIAGYPSNLNNTQAMYSETELFGKRGAMVKFYLKT
jgi:hypothetical protein